MLQSKKFHRFWVTLGFALFFSTEARPSSLWVDVAATYPVPQATGIPGAFDRQSQIAGPGGGFGFESGKFAFDFQYLPRAYYDGYNEYRFNVLQHSTMFRLWLGGRRKKIVGLGLGGFFSYGVSATRDGTSFDPATYGLKNIDAGVVGGVIVQLPYTFFLEARVAYSIVDSATAPNQTFRNMDFIILSGFRFGGSSRR